jgi:hypothetical protein
MNYKLITLREHMSSPPVFVLFWVFLWFFWVGQYYSSFQFFVLFNYVFLLSDFRVVYPMLPVSLHCPLLGVHKTKYENKQYETTHNTIYVRHHYIQTNTNNVNKTCVLLQTNTNNVNKT